MIKQQNGASELTSGQQRGGHSGFFFSAESQLIKPAFCPFLLAIDELILADISAGL